MARQKTKRARNICMADEMWERIENRAIFEGVSMSQIIREAVNAYFRQRGSRGKQTQDS
jgi:predicted DNA-binding protein